MLIVFSDLEHVQNAGHVIAEIIGNGLDLDSCFASAAWYKFR